MLRIIQKNVEPLVPSILMESIQKYQGFVL